MMALTVQLEGLLPEHTGLGTYHGCDDSLPRIGELVCIEYGKPYYRVVDIEWRYWKGWKPNGCTVHIHLKPTEGEG